MNRPIVHFDDAAEVITINGVRYSYGLFAHFGFGEIGRKFTIEERADGVVTVHVEPSPAREP